MEKELNVISLILHKLLFQFFPRNLLLISSTGDITFLDKIISFFYSIDKEIYSIVNIDKINKFKYGLVKNNIHFFKSLEKLNETYNNKFDLIIIYEDEIKKKIIPSIEKLLSSKLNKEGVMFLVGETHKYKEIYNLFNSNFPTCNINLYLKSNIDQEVFDLGNKIMFQFNIKSILKK